MTGNVAQAIVERTNWLATLRAVLEALHPEGRLVFETRDPRKEAWREWNLAESYRVIDVDGVGPVEHWVELTNVSGPLVSFRGSWVFAADGELLTSDSTLRFRDPDEVRADLTESGFLLEAVRDAPDRPGREFVFFAQLAE